MGYVIDWSSDPFFPRIKPVPEGGDSIESLTLALLRHHLETAASHFRAMERLLGETPDLC
jgi:hypothetical protein